MSGRQADALESDGSSWDQPISLQAFAIERVVGHDDYELVRIETSSKYFFPMARELIKGFQWKEFYRLSERPVFLPHESPKVSNCSGVALKGLLSAFLICFSGLEKDVPSKCAQAEPCSNLWAR